MQSVLYHLGLPVYYADSLHSNKPQHPGHDEPGMAEGLMSWCHLFYKVEDKSSRLEVTISIKLSKPGGQEHLLQSERQNTYFVALKDSPFFIYVFRF